MTETAGTSGTGAALCQFVVAKTDIAKTVTIQMSLTTAESAATFATVKKQKGNQSVSGVGDSSFYTPSNHTLQFIVRHTVVALNATPSPAHLSAAAARTLRTDLISLGAVIAAQQ